MRAISIGALIVTILLGSCVGRKGDVLIRSGSEYDLTPNERMSLERRQNTDPAASKRLWLSYALGSREHDKARQVARRAAKAKHRWAVEYIRKFPSGS